MRDSKATASSDPARMNWSSVSRVEAPVATDRDELVDQETVVGQRVFDCGPVFGCRNRHDRLVSAQTFTEELGHCGNQLVVTVVEAHEMFVTLRVGIVHAGAHEANRSLGLGSQTLFACRMSQNIGDHPRTMRTMRIMTSRTMMVPMP